jgi:hypothetical protein
VARDAVATRRGFGSPQATSQEREVAHPAKGCFLVGTARSKNWVSNSVNAMTQINQIIQEDGTGNITVTVAGPSTK